MKWGHCTHDEGWRWEIYFIEDGTNRLHEFASTRMFWSYSDALDSAMKHLDSGVLEDEIPGRYTLVDIIISYRGGRR